MFIRSVFSIGLILFATFSTCLGQDFPSDYRIDPVNPPTSFPHPAGGTWVFDSGTDYRNTSNLSVNADWISSTSGWGWFTSYYLRARVFGSYDQLSQGTCSVLDYLHRDPGVLGLFVNSITKYSSDGSGRINQHFGFLHTQGIPLPVAGARLIVSSSQDWWLSLRAKIPQWGYNYYGGPPPIVGVTGVPPFNTPVKAVGSH